jgi:predicted phage terminase large subunit-like protein
MTTEEIKLLKVAKYKCLQSSLFFTRYFFKKRFNRKFVIGEHHEKISLALDRVFRGECKRLIINIAPRYGKTELAVKNFIANGLALNPASKYIHLSYSDDLALDNSEEVKDIIKSADYQTLFPNVQVKAGTDSKKKWYTTAGGGVYATAAAGQVTGFGAGKVDEEEELIAALNEIELKEGFAGALIIDDPIKPEDADSELVRERVNARFDSTIRNRVNSRNTPIIIIMQRLHEHDLCGYLIDNEGSRWEVLSLPSIKENGSALWPFKHTLEELKELELLNPVVFERQHLQNPQPLKGRLYKIFRTYKELPPSKGQIRAAVDTADEGNDYLCSIVYMKTTTAYYLLDVYYTQDGTETTEGQTAKQFMRNSVDLAWIESNNGGKAFSRNVERFCREASNTRVTIKWFHQTKNKEARIKSQAADVQNMIYYPEDWERRWPAFAKAVKFYVANGKNKNDDAPDALTMIIETANKNVLQIIE